MACAECDEFLPYSEASSIPLCYVLFPATLLHQLFFRPLSLHLTIYFLVYLSALLFPNSYIFWGGILFSSILCTCRNQRNWYYNNIVYILMYLVSHTLCIKTVIGIIHSFIHSIGMCRMRRFLAVLRSFFHSSLLFTFPCHPFPPTILRSSLTSSCHLFLGLPLNLVVSDFIYNTLLGILFSSTLCTCPNQHNLFNLIVSITVGFVTLG